MLRPSRLISPRLAVVAAYVAVVTIWGATWAFMKIGVAEVPPFTFALQRAVGTAVLLTAASLLLGLRFPSTPRTALAAAVAGVFATGVNWAVVFWAIQYVPSGAAAVLGSSAPLWTAVMAHFIVAGDRLSGRKALGLVCGIIGVGMIVLSPATLQDPGPLYAWILLAVAPVTWAVAAIISARYLTEASPMPTTALGAAAGAVVLMPFAGGEAVLSPLPAPAAGALLYLVLASGVALTLSLWLYRRLRPTTVMLTQVLIPLQAVAIGVLLLGETLSLYMIGGALLVILAVVLNAFSGGAEVPSEP